MSTSPIAAASSFICRHATNPHTCKDMKSFQISTESAPHFIEKAHFFSPRWWLLKKFPVNHPAFWIFSTCWLRKLNVLTFQSQHVVFLISTCWQKTVHDRDISANSERTNRWTVMREKQEYRLLLYNYNNKGILNAQTETVHLFVRSGREFFCLVN